MLRFTLKKPRPPLGGGASATLLEFALVKRSLGPLLRTLRSLPAFQENLDAPPHLLFSNLKDATQLLDMKLQAVMILPALVALVPEVVGELEYLPDAMLAPNHIRSCGAFLFELAARDLDRRVVSLRLVAIVSSEEPHERMFEPDPALVESGLLWKLTVPQEGHGKFFSGGEDLETWLEMLGREERAGEVPGVEPRAVVGGATAASVPPVGKLGYVVNVGTDGRAWRSTSWEKYISDMRESINLIRCADWTRYKSIAGEFVVRVEAAEWVAKLASYEFIAPCPGWADTVGHLPSLRCLNVFGKEEMLFAGKVSRTDYSLISWEQFVPRGHIYDRKLTFNSLLLACDGFRVACLFYFGRAW